MLLKFIPLGTGMNHEAHRVVLAHKPKAGLLAGYLVKQLMALSQPVHRVLVKADEPSCLILGTHGQGRVKRADVAEDFTLPESLRHNNGHALSIDSLEEPVCLKFLFFCCFAVVASHIPEKLPIANVEHHPAVVKAIQVSLPVLIKEGCRVNAHHRGLVWKAANHLPHYIGRSVNGLGCARRKESVKFSSLQLVGQPVSPVGPDNLFLAISQDSTT